MSKSGGSPCWSARTSTCSPSVGAMATARPRTGSSPAICAWWPRSLWDIAATALPSPQALSEGNVGLMQALKRFEPEKGFRFATYATWWIKAAIQEYILRSWSLVKLGTTANQKKLFFNLRKTKSKISAMDEGDLRPDQVKIIARWLGVTEQDVVDMNRRLGGDASLNAPIREDGDSGEWMDWLVDDSVSQESRMVAEEQAD